MSIEDDLALVYNTSSGSSDESPEEREGNRVDNDEEAMRRAAERRLIMRNSPLSRANLEAITERLGIEAAERFRSMIESRRRETNSRVTSRVDIIWLKPYLTQKDLMLVDENNASYIRTIVGWYGPFAAVILLRLDNAKANSMK